MGIDLATFNKAKAPLPERIRAFLSAGKGTAFSKAEIVAGVEGVDGQTALLLMVVDTGRSKQFQAALDALVNDPNSKVDRADYAGNTYYAYLG